MMTMMTVAGPELTERLARDGIEDVESLYGLSLREITKMYGKMALRDIQEGLEGAGLPALGEMTLVMWPSSQLCMDCTHGCFLMVLPSSTYGCADLQVLGPCESTCAGFEPKEISNEE